MSTCVLCLKAGLPQATIGAEVQLTDTRGLGLQQRLEHVCTLAHMQVMHATRHAVSTSKPAWPRECLKSVCAPSPPARRAILQGLRIPMATDIVCLETGFCVLYLTGHLAHTWVQ